MFETREKGGKQEELWLVKRELCPAPAQGFYQRVDQTLGQMDFAGQVRALCAPAYADQCRGGRPGIDPAVYFKMLLVGFFEDLGSERAIASRCDDSRSIRAFLGYELTEATPDHSSLSVIRQRLGVDIYQKVFEVILAALHVHGLLKGRNLGIDSSVIEANAALRSLVSRNDEQSYWDYVRGLTVEAGVDPKDTAAVRNFDRKRKGRKTSNLDWKNKHEPDARVGRDKHGATDLLHKPEHISDLDTGTIIHAEVRLGDAGDTVALAPRIAVAAATLQTVIDPQHQPAALGADKGYFKLEEIEFLQQAGLTTVVSDPIGARRLVDKLEPEQKAVWERARDAVKSEEGKALLRRRGMHLERSFAHVLDAGGMRRTTLRGLENLNKRYKIAAACFNLSQLLRKLYKFGTPKQWVASRFWLFGALYRRAGRHSGGHSPFMTGHRQINRADRFLGRIISDLGHPLPARA